MKKITDTKIKFGRVVILGRPNTGKSTLLNAIMSQKVAITSPMAQTTRKNTRVVFSNEKGKIIFSDTPGIIDKVSDLIGKRVNTEAPKEVGRADVILCILDISRPKNEEENKVIGLVRKSKAKKNGKSYVAPNCRNFSQRRFTDVFRIHLIKPNSKSSRKTPRP